MAAEMIFEEEMILGINLEARKWLSEGNLQFSSRNISEAEISWNNSLQIASNVICFDIGLFLYFLSIFFLLFLNLTLF